MTVVRAIGCFPLRRPEIWMLSLAVLLLLVMASVSYTDWRLYQRADRHALQIRDALTALDQFLDTMLDAETGQRGFLLTDDAPYLEPYAQALQAAPHHLTQLTQALAALQDGEDEGTPLRLLAEQKLAELRETLDVYRMQGLPAALEVVRSTRGKRLMDDIRRRCAHLHQGLTTALYAEWAQVDAHARRTHLVAVGGALLLFGFLLVAGVTIHRAMQGQERALAETRATRDLLETTLASIGDAVLATDAAGRMVFANPTAQALLRWRRRGAGQSHDAHCPRWHGNPHR
jgi:CHASE3 domain sensor protein